jgi:plastocyanin
MPVLVFFWLATAAVDAGPVTGSVRLIHTGFGMRPSNDCSGVAIWLVPPEGTGPPILPKTLQMAQRKKHFDPPIMVIPVGSTVTFPNFDPIFHNVFSNYSGQIFDVGLKPPATVPKVEFTRPGIVRVFCNIHPTMSAVIVVVSTPYMAVSGADGAFRIEGVRPGEYRFHVFDEQALEETLNGLERSLTVGNDPVNLEPIEVSESGYIQVPHKNKYGQDYPAVIEDRPMYPPGKVMRH